MESECGLSMSFVTQCFDRIDLGGLTSRVDPSANLRRLTKNVLHDAAIHVGQSEIPAVMRIREPFVVDPQQVQNRRVQVVQVHSAPGPAGIQSRRSRHAQSPA